MILTLMLVLLSASAVSLCVLLTATYFLAYPFRDDALATRVAAVILLGCIGAEQVLHLGYFLEMWPLLEQRVYGALLCSQIGGFYVFSAGVLGLPQRTRWIVVGHGALALAALWRPNWVLIPLSFAVGGGYAGYFSWRIFQLRDQYPRRALELKIFALFLAMAVLLTVLGLLLTLLPTPLLAGAYSAAVWTGLVTVVFSLIKYPDWAVASIAIARARYAQSTLKQVDCSRARATLETQLADPHVTRDPRQNLAGVAARVALTPHQLSELINTEFHCSFSTLLRRRRIEDAKRRLLAEPTASVLAIGLEVGFTSQSNFYSAFREVVGCTPGAFRRKASQ